MAANAAAKTARVKRKISRISKEIEEIDSYFYSIGISDLDQKASMLERKRDDIVRSTVLQLHTAIEDVLDTLLLQSLQKGAGNSTYRGTKAYRAANDILKGGRSIGFDKKLSLAIALNVLREPTLRALKILNELRNKCSHNWLLNVRIRRGRRPKDPKLPLLRFKGRNLHGVEALKELFSEYGEIYVRLFIRSRNP